MYGETFYGRHTAQHELQWGQIKIRNEIYCFNASLSQIICSTSLKALVIVPMYTKYGYQRRARGSSCIRSYASERPEYNYFHIKVNRQHKHIGVVNLNLDPILFLCILY